MVKEMMRQVQCCARYQCIYILGCWQVNELLAIWSSANKTGALTMDVATNFALLPIVIDAHYFECVYQKEQQPIFINKHYRILLRILL